MEPACGGATRIGGWHNAAFNNGALRGLAKVPSTLPHYAVVNSPSTNGPVKRIKGGMGAHPNQMRHPLAKWVQLVPGVQWVMSTDYRERCKARRIQNFRSRSRTLAGAFAVHEGNKRVAEMLDRTRVQAQRRVGQGVRATAPRSVGESTCKSREDPSIGKQGRTAEVCAW